VNRQILCQVQREKIGYETNWKTTPAAEPVQRIGSRVTPH